jgi:hypothetical protein
LGPVRTDRPVRRTRVNSKKIVTEAEVERRHTHDLGIAVLARSRFGPLGLPMCHDSMGAGRTKATHSADIAWEQVHSPPHEGG